MSWQVVKLKEDGGEFLALRNTESKWWPRNDEIADINPSYSANDLAELLDHDAENINAHDFVGCHKELLGLLRDFVSSPDALEIMDAIRRRRGLHGLVDCCGCVSRS
jgi:hypothetical protein